MFDESVGILAKTIYGEARGCGASGMRNVASVVLNRTFHPSWWGTSIATVCQQPYQFSCWLIDDPNSSIIRAVTDVDPVFRLAISIAQTAVARKLPDFTNGADSYYALTMHTPPAWAAKAVRTYSDGWHAFYRTVVSAPLGSSPDIRNVSADDLNAKVLDGTFKAGVNP